MSRIYNGIGRKGLVTMKSDVYKSDDGRYFILAEDGFVASFKNNEWVNKLLFDAYQMEDEFHFIQDSEESESVLKWARSVLASKETP